MFKALVLNQVDGKTQASIETRDDVDLPPGNVIVNVAYSSLNYKDGLAITGKGKIIRNFPMVPGIDYAGVVEQSADPKYKAGDEVVLTGWGVGENHSGGMAQKTRVPAEFLVPMPQGLDAVKAMSIGTAGLTAMLCVMAIEEAGITPQHGEVLVTGASGGVGSVAVQLLSTLGYTVVASSGRPENATLLKKLGAARVMDRSELTEAARPLEKQVWAAAVDTVGSSTLAKVLAQMDYNGVVAACGLAGGFDLPTTVMPFILRNVRLQGVDSVMAPYARRVQAWQRIAELLPASFYEQATRTITLEEVPAAAEAITKGQITGRVLIQV